MDDITKEDVAAGLHEATKSEDWLTEALIQIYVDSFTPAPSFVVMTGSPEGPCRGIMVTKHLVQIGTIQKVMVVQPEYEYHFTEDPDVSLPY